MLEVPELKDCSEVKSFFVQFYLLLAKSQGELERNDDFVNKCFLEMDKDFLVLLNLSKDELKNEERFRKYLSQSGASNKLRKKALSIYRVKRKRTSQRVVVESFVELSALELPKEMTPIKYKELYSYLKKVEDLNENHPLRHFVELGVALRTENKEWVKKISGKIINSSALQYALFLDPRKFTGKLYVQLLNAIHDTLSLMKKEKKEPMILRMVVTRMLFFIPSKYKERFRSDFNVNWSLIELREVVGNRKFGESAVGLWFNVLENRTTEAEVNRFLDRILRKTTLRKLPREEFWILKHFYPGDDRRGLVENRLATFVKKKNSVHDNLILNEILEREPIQKSLSSIEPRLGRALFKVKRELFQEVLSSGYPSQFALYHLFLMGEKDPELFWWFVL